MKIVILALLLAFSFAANMVQKDGNIHFEADSSPESPIGLFMKGKLSPTNEGDSSVETFFRLAEQLIPIAQSKIDDNESGKLTYFRKWCFGNTGDAISVCVYANAELWVGWKVSHNGEAGLYNVTYTPFTVFRGGVNASASSYPAEVSYGGYISVVDIQVPINLLLAQNQICYSGTFYMFPTGAYTAINTNLLQCERSIADRTAWNCDRVHGVEFRHLEFDFTQELTIALLPHTCINF